MTQHILRYDHNSQRFGRFWCIKSCRISFNNSTDGHKRKDLVDSQGRDLSVGFSLEA